MNLNNIEKTNYIKNNFHQFFDMQLNTNITTTENVNLVIPIEDLTKGNTVSDAPDDYHHDVNYPNGYNIQDILQKYEDTDLEYDIEGICLDVIDGDTIKVKLLYEVDGHSVPQIEIIRLVGVNTPEEGKSGYEVSKTFMKKICYSEKYYTGESEYNDKKIRLKFDNLKKYDNYHRRLAVLISQDGKNINEVLIKEKIAEIWYIPPSEFYPYDWGTYNSSVHVYNFTNSDITILSPYFNPEMTNVVFTPRDNPDIIYRFEAYRGVYFIKLKPFSEYIRMHILPKEYDCSSTILFFRDDMLKRKNVKKSDDYRHYPVENFINSYYLDGEDIRDRTNPDISSDIYNPNEWNNTFCEFSYNISKNTKGLNNIQICAGYRYNNSTPFYSLHYMGIKDNTNQKVEDRCTLIDANYDRLESISNNITQYHYDEEEKLYIPNPKKEDIEMIAHYENNVDHVSQEKIGKINHKIIKYINDTLYSEENKQSTIGQWKDVSQ